MGWCLGYWARRGGCGGVGEHRPRAAGQGLLDQAGPREGTPMRAWAACQPVVRAGNSLPGPLAMQGRVRLVSTSHTQAEPRSPWESPASGENHGLRSQTALRPVRSHLSLASARRRRQPYPGTMAPVLTPSSSIGRGTPSARASRAGLRASRLSSALACSA